jgi:hypothetical protein
MRLGVDGLQVFHEVEQIVSGERAIACHQRRVCAGEEQHCDHGQVMSAPSIAQPA